MKFSKIFLLSLLAAYGSSALALPALQLGGDGTSSWYYEGVDQTWTTYDSNLDLNAYANATKANGGNGGYAWADGTSSTGQYAYLIVAAVPDLGVADPFDVSILNDGSSLTTYTSGWGNPPLQDSNSLAPHDIYDTYFEIYEIVFDGAIGEITDQQPVSSQIDPTSSDHDPGKGYTETLSISINSTETGLSGIHFDLFTVKGGKWDLSAIDKKLVTDFAPFSHDAEYKVPEPGILMLFGLGLVGVFFTRRRVR